MRRILKERDRLLGIGSRSVGMGATATAILCASVPGAIAMPGYLLTLICMLLLGLCQYRLVSPNPLPWLTAALRSRRRLHSRGWSGGIAAAEHGEYRRRRRDRIRVAGIAGDHAGRLTRPPGGSRRRTGDDPGRALVVILSGRTSTPEAVALILLAGWAACAAIGVWLCRAVPRVIAGILEWARHTGRDGLASEAEARRRQGAGSCMTRCWPH